MVQAQTVRRTVCVRAHLQDGGDDLQLVGASAFAMAHFGVAAYATTPGEAQPVSRSHRGGVPRAMAALDGVLHLVHPGTANSPLLTERFSVAGLMTHGRPVSQRQSRARTGSNGFRTLAEAGWSPQEPVNRALCAVGGALAMARLGDGLLLAARSSVIVRSLPVAVAVRSIRQPAKSAVPRWKWRRVVEFVRRGSTRATRKSRARPTAWPAATAWHRPPCRLRDTALGRVAPRSRECARALAGLARFQPATAACAAASLAIGTR